MLVTSAACGPLEANLYVVASDEGNPCLIIDPGQESWATAIALVKRHGLTPVAVLATHGHFDHVADAARLADHYGVPVWIHSTDRHLLTDPGAGLGPVLEGWLRAILPDSPVEPARLEVLDSIEHLELAGLSITVTHAPGHSRGSVLYTVDAHPQPLVFSGDVLFAGSIGRSDLVGSDHQAMLTTLRALVAHVPDQARILPGHGPSTTMARERVSNPYLGDHFLA